MKNDPKPADPAPPAPASDPAPVDPQPADPAPATDPLPADPPADPATPADPPPADPAAPVTYDLALPDNSLLRDADVTFVAEEAKALGLSQDQAQALLTARAQAVQTMADGFLADAKADPQLGAQWAETEAHAKAGIEWALKDSSAEEKALVLDTLNRTALGNHKAWIRMMARIGRARAEDSTTGTSRTASVGRPRDAADTLYGQPASA